jgi:hypothetical protein
MTAASNSLFHRMIRAAMLDSHVYEEVEHDKGAIWQAMAVVVLSSLAAGVGAVRTGGMPSLIFLTLAALVGWVVWAFTTHLIGTRLLPEPQTRSNLGELLRTTGFSSSPGVIRILGLIPGLGFLSAFVAAIWMLLTMVIAVRQALDYRNTGRAIGVCLIGWLIWIILMLLVGPGPFSGTAV